MTTKRVSEPTVRGRGGLGVIPKKTACLFIEFQNEFATEGGKLHGQVKEVMELTGMLAKTVDLVRQMRHLGVTIFHAPISFSRDGSDNPNPKLGILAGCDHDSLFTRDTWNAAICDPMAPEPGDVVVVGKHGLSAFANTDLETELRSRGIETIALGGFMANCCVESSMRDAYEKGFNVITLTDCVATTSVAGYRAAVDITYPFFSTPMNAETFTANVNAAVALSEAPSTKRVKTCAGRHPVAEWSVKEIGVDVYQLGPWFVDVRTKAIGGKITVGSGASELRRYLTFAQASGEHLCCSDNAYTEHMPQDGESTEPFGWLCNMSVIRVATGGCVVYSPVLGPDNTMDAVVKALSEQDLLPVKLIIAPSPQHHLALLEWQKLWPEAFLVCGKASGQMQPLTKTRRDLRFDGVLSVSSSGSINLSSAGVVPTQLLPELKATALEALPQISEILESTFKVCVVGDDRSGEIVLLHLKSKSLIISDLLYKSNPAVTGPGGGVNHYTTPEWFAEGQEELFYGHATDNSGGLLPCYRTHPRMRTLDIPGMRSSLRELLGWEFERALACHTDPMTGEECRGLIQTAWQWLWEPDHEDPRE